MSHKIVFFITEGSVLTFAWREYKTVKTSIRIPGVLSRPKFERRATYMHSRCSIHLSVTFGWHYLEDAIPTMVSWACFIHWYTDSGILGLHFLEIPVILHFKLHCESQHLPRQVQFAYGNLSSIRSHCRDTVTVTTVLQIHKSVTSPYGPVSVM
jgi:hypothetical protein